MLNECVLWEVYPIPKVDETLAQLSGAAVFSKLDANSWLLANPNSRRVKAPDDLHHSLREILV